MKRLKAKKALCAALAMSLTIPALPINAETTDTKGHWAEKTITQWQDRGLISGYEDGTFKPNKEITRAEFVRILNTVLKLTKTGEVKFTDVKDKDWYYKDIQIAVGEGYANGTPENKFMPNSTLTRAEAAVFIANILKEKSDNKISFADMGDIPSWARQAIALMVGKGYMTGYPDNTFSARKNLTRAEAVTILDKVTSKVQVIESTNKDKEEKAKVLPKAEQKSENSKRVTGSSGGGSTSGTQTASKALGAKTVKNAQELIEAVHDGYNDITVDTTGKIEKDVELNYLSKEPLKITINNAQDGLNKIKLTALNTTKITLVDDGKQDKGTVLDEIIVDAPNAHVETSFKLTTVNIVRVASSTFRALDEVSKIKIQNKAKVEVTDTTFKPNIEIQTEDEVKLVGKYETVITAKNSNISLEKNSEIKEYAPSANANQSMITGGTIEKITVQSNLTVKDSKVKNIVIPSTTSKKITMNIQGVAEIKKIVNESNHSLKLNTEKTGQVEDTTEARLEKKQVEKVMVNGVPKIGYTLTAQTTPLNANVTYKWMVSNNEGGNYVAIDNATNKEYTVTGDEAGKYIKVEATGTGDYEKTVFSNSVKIEDLVNVNKVEIDGKNEVGEILTAKVTPSNAEVTYQWKKSPTADGSYEDIVGGVEKTYKIKKGDKFLKVEVKNKYDETNKATSNDFAVNQRDNQLDVKLKPAVKNFNTNIKVTTDTALLTDKISFKYEIGDNALTYSKNENIDASKVSILKELENAVVTHKDGEDVELDENTVNDIVKGNSKYLTVYQLNKISTTTPNQLVAYASMKLTKDLIRLPEKKEWEVRTTHTIKGDKIFIKGRLETVGNIKAALQIISKGQDVKKDFDINVKTSSEISVQDSSALSESYIIEITPKAINGNKYIYGEGKALKVNFTDEIDSVKFKEGTAIQVGDTLTAQVFIKFNGFQESQSLEGIGSEYKYENLKYKWYTEENGTKNEIIGEKTRKYTVKQKDIGKSIKVEVTGDGVEVANTTKESGGTLNVTEKKIDISVDGKAYEIDTSKINIKILDKDQVAIDDSKIKVEVYIGGKWESIKDKVVVKSADNKEYEVQLKNITQISGNTVRLTIDGTNCVNKNIYIHRSLEGVEFNSSFAGLAKAKIEGSKLVIKDSSVTIKNLFKIIGERLELKISGVRAELYDSSGYLITEDKADDYFKTGMKLRVSSETAYPNTQPKEYVVTVE
ncbi:MAG: S-layer homology domain-containing protein [Peptoanaerobacter stomatis]|uniref:S-layer homology domain-containing protein n=1 Tax=Peptoanaerobacter stomatis TaxID=796937 RepID=UPI003F9F7DEC